MKCRYHPGRDSVSVKFGQPYCQQCTDGITEAVTQVPSHVQPKDCFVQFQGGDDWGPIPGTGCAHWVSHERNNQSGQVCLASCTYRVKDLIQGKTAIDRANVAVNDIYVTPPEDHCGLVIQVTTGGTKITIRHDSSAQGGVVENDFDQHFGGTGTFYR